MKLRAFRWAVRGELEFIYQTHSTDEHKLVSENQIEVQRILEAAADSAQDALNRLREDFNARKRIG